MEKWHDIEHKRFQNFPNLLLVFRDVCVWSGPQSLKSSFISELKKHLLQSVEWNLVLKRSTFDKENSYLTWYSTLDLWEQSKVSGQEHIFCRFFASGSLGSYYDVDYFASSQDCHHIFSAVNDDPRFLGILKMRNNLEFKLHVTDLIDWSCFSFLSFFDPYVLFSDSKGPQQKGHIISP